MEAANGADDKANAIEARNAGPLRGRMGNRSAAATTQGRTNMNKMFMRLWSFREALRVRSNTRKGKRHLRVRIWML